MSINHGANLFDLSNELGINKKDIKDFSSNINPFGASKKAKDAILNNIDMVSIYPDPKYKDLKESISQYCHCKKENIIVGSGATELISSFISVINPKKALLLSPSYSEYESELEKINCEITKFFSKEEDNFKIDVNKLIDSINSSKFDLVIICNPNNPTGFAFSKDEISLLLKNTSSIFMVDETYVEFTEPEIYSSTPLVDIFNNLFVIRGTSKFFSTPGIRLGYGLISNKEIKKSMVEKLDLWNINIFATTMGEIMFKDKEYIQEAMKYGAFGYMLKDSAHDVIYEGIKTAYKGNMLSSNFSKNGFMSSIFSQLNDKSCFSLFTSISIIFLGINEKFLHFPILGFSSICPSK